MRERRVQRRCFDAPFSMSRSLRFRPEKTMKRVIWPWFGAVGAIRRRNGSQEKHAAQVKPAALAN